MRRDPFFIVGRRLLGGLGVWIIFSAFGCRVSRAGQGIKVGVANPKP